MALNMKTLTQALAKTAAVIEKHVQTTVQEVTGPKPLQDYDLFDQIGSAGPGLAWKLYSAKSRLGSTQSQQYPTVCVWVLDKKALSEARQRAGLSKAAEDAFLDLIRADAAKMVRLRHPGVVHVVQGLDENKNAMAMVTEPLFASVANVVGNVRNIAKLPKELKGLEMGLLEVKHGLLQVAESLDFLHNNGRLIHRAIAPENIFVTSSGSWKLGGFGFAISSGQSGDLANVQAFHYAEYDVEDSVLPLQPSMNYTAPELIRRKSSPAGCYSDIFSFGCLAYHLIARKPLFDCHNNVKMYMNTLSYLSNEAFSSIPRELVPDLQKMLSANESFRPTALDFTGSPFFRDDTGLRALRFLDHMLERDNMQKSEFLKALSDMWKDFDSRVLQYKVLPPLCAELRNMVLQPMILPMVLMIAESQDRNDFELSTLPALVPVLSTASGETLLLLVKHAEHIIAKISHEHMVSHVLPLLVRAYDDNDARIQEEVLRKTVSLAKQVDVQLVKQAILPRVHALALKTTVAAVRVNALLCLGDLVHTLDKHAILEILQTIQRCTAVDRSPPTLMCTLGVSNSILKQFGIEFVVEHVLPLLIPLLTAQQLNVQQFAKYMLFVKDILRKIEEKRGVSLTDFGFSEVTQSTFTDKLQPNALKMASGSVAPTTGNNSMSWDEDWGPARKGSITSPHHTIDVTSSNNLNYLSSGNQPIQATSSNNMNHSSSGSRPIQVISMLPQSQQNTQSCPPVDLEWPPRTSGVTTQLGSTEIQIQNGGGASLGTSFDEIDPFANWPPRNDTSSTASAASSNNGGGVRPFAPTNSCGSSISLNKTLPADYNSCWAFNGHTSVTPLTQQGSSALNASSLYNSTGLNAQKKTDIGSIFASNKTEQTALRLAPPPLTAVGLGRGRARGNRAQTISQAGNSRSSSEQPPLLDLL